MATRKVRCPQCGEYSLWSTENAWRPFCSERCKQIDLGCWANESYRIPVTEAVEVPADNEAF
ncbi:MAG: DNA gyrase inhibitor YacG [Azonexus sp.]|nr:DNA gyrase inhibitor YacG [Azonexus sp.]MDZ4315406.1 DNA gyrase inhibitor YacG [Azonexus sp.]